MQVTVGFKALFTTQTFLLVNRNIARNPIQYLVSVVGSMQKDSNKIPLICKKGDNNIGFVPISIDKYVKMHLKSNPIENEKDLRNRLNSALADYKKGIKCSCGNDIWVIGSASVGNSCFTCITGESFPTDDYEIDTAIKKSENKKGRRHINEIDPINIAGYFDDDGYEINTELINKPSLCLTCINDDNPNEEMLCNMTRYDQRNDDDFKCYAYLKR